MWLDIAFSIAQTKKEFSYKSAYLRRTCFLNQNECTAVIFPCYRCVTTANILLQVIVDSVAGGDDSDCFIKYILHQRILCFDGGWNVIYPVCEYEYGQYSDYALLFRAAHDLTSWPCA